MAYKNAGAKLNTTAQTTVFTAEALTLANAIYLSNTDINNDITISVHWTDSSAGITYSLITGVLLPKQAALQILDRPIVLESDDLIKVTASAANKAEVTISAFEI